MLWTIDQVATELAVTRREVQDLGRRAVDPLPLVKLGHRTVRAEPDAIRAWVKRQGQKADAVGADV